MIVNSRIEKSQKALTGIIWVALDNVSVALISLGSLIVMARLLGPLEFAAAAVAWSSIQLVTPLASALFHDVIVQRRPLSLRAMQSAWLTSILIGVGLMVVSFPVGSMLARVMGLPSVATLLPAMATTLIIQGIGSVPTAFARRRLRYQALAVRSSVGRLGACAVGVTTALLGWGAWAIVAQQIAAAAFSTLLILPRAGIRFRLSAMDFSSLCPLVRYSFISLTGLMIGTAAPALTTLILGIMTGPVSLAYWNLAFRIVDPLQVIFGTAANHWGAPQMARLQGDVPALRQMYEAAAKGFAYLALPAFTGLSLCASEVVELFMGSDWLASVPIVRVLGVVAAVMLARQMGLIALIATGRIDSTVYITGLSTFIGLLGLGLGGLIGLNVAALGYSLRILPFWFLTGRAVNRALNLPVRNQNKQLFGPIIGLVSLCTIVLFISALLPATTSPLSRLVLYISLGVPAYFGTTWLVIGPAMRSELRSIINYKQNRGVWKALPDKGNTGV